MHESRPCGRRTAAPGERHGSQTSLACQPLVQLLQQNSSTLNVQPQVREYKAERDLRKAETESAQL